jgi:hypothetical protein
MATPRQNPLDSQGARTPMNGEPMDLIQLITRTESLLGDADLGTNRSLGRLATLADYPGVIRSRRASVSLLVRFRFPPLAHPWGRVPVSSRSVTGHGPSPAVATGVFRVYLKAQRRGCRPAVR